MLADHDKMVEKIAESCRMLGELEVTKEALGHVSWRIPGTETMLIKGKGPGEVGLRFTQPREIKELALAVSQHVAPTSGSPLRLAS